MSPITPQPHVATERDQELVAGLEQAQGGPCLSLDPVVARLEAENTVRAVQFGLQVGQDAIAQVLLGGAGPLGAKPTDLRPVSPKGQK